VLGSERHAGQFEQGMNDEIWGGSGLTMREVMTTKGGVMTIKGGLVDGCIKHGGVPDAETLSHLLVQLARFGLKCFERIQSQSCSSLQRGRTGFAGAREL
jgi:hypothetical protein